MCDGDAAQACTCIATLSFPADNTGTYSTDGNTVTTQTGKDPAEVADYCIDGDTLRVRDPETPEEGVTVYARGAK
jgi:hypothetical protein